MCRNGWISACHKREVVPASVHLGEMARGLVSDTNGTNWCLLSAVCGFGGVVRGRMECERNHGGAMEWWGDPKRGA